MEILVWLHVPIVISFDVVMNEISVSLWNVTVGEKITGLGFQYFKGKRANGLSNTCQFYVAVF